MVRTSDARRTVLPCVEEVAGHSGHERWGGGPCSKSGGRDFPFPVVLTASSALPSGYDAEARRIIETMTDGMLQEVNEARYAFVPTEPSASGSSVTAVTAEPNTGRAH